MLQGGKLLPDLFEIVHLLPCPLCVPLTHVLNRLLRDALDRFLAVLLCLIVSEVFWRLRGEQALVVARVLSQVFVNNVEHHLIHLLCIEVYHIIRVVREDPDIHLIQEP
jgi:hypothetical protein